MTIVTSPAQSRPSTLESARSAVSAALAGLADKSRNGVRQSDIAIQEAAVRQAQVGVRQAKRDLDAPTLVARFDGVGSQRQLCPWRAAAVCICFINRRRLGVSGVRRPQPSAGAGY